MQRQRFLSVIARCSIIRSRHTQVDNRNKQLLTIPVEVVVDEILTDNTILIEIFQQKRFGR